MVEGSLAGYRVLEMANESAVYGAKLLADLGADVIKVEPPCGDSTRRMPPFFGGQVGPEHSLFFAYMNTNKRSITLDLETATGQALLRRLAESADVVYESFPPGHLSERNVGFEELSALNPRLVWTAVTPFGQNGPRRDWKGSDIVAWAMSGVLSTLGQRDRPPVVPAGAALLAFAAASLNAAAGTLIALRSRGTLRRGQLVDISIQEAATAVSPEIGLPVFLDDLMPRARFGNRRPLFAPFGLYPCKDGYVAVVATLPHHWDALAAWIKERTGVDEVIEPRYRDRIFRGQIRETVDGWTEGLTREYTKDVLFEEGQARGVPITPVNTVADVSRDPQLEARDFWQEVLHPVLGNLRMAGAPFRLNKTPWRPGRAPLLGEHNEEIYGELGLAARDLMALRTSGAI